MGFQPVKWASSLLNPTTVVPIWGPEEPETKTLYEKLTSTNFLVLAGLGVFALVKLK